MNDNYDYIEFKDASNGLVHKRVGIKCGDYLVVSYTSEYDKTFRIFNVLTGKPVIKTRFVNREEAVSLANKISDTVGEFFYMNKDYPMLDMISVSKWSTKGGLELDDLVEKIRVFDVLERMVSWY